MTQVETTQIIRVSLIDDIEDPIRPLDGAKVCELRESIKIYGLLQPLVLHQKSNSRYGLVIGRHRFYAIKGLEWEFVEAKIKHNLLEIDILFLSLQENIQRLEMDPVSEGEIYFMLSSKGYSMEVLIERLSKTRYYIKSRISIYKNLHEDLKTQIGKTITISNAISLSKHGKSRQIEIYQEILKQANTKPEIRSPFGGSGGMSPPSKFCKCPKCSAKHLKGVSIEE